jgi:hypothetical protein
MRKFWFHHKKRAKTKRKEENVRCIRLHKGLQQYSENFKRFNIFTNLLLLFSITCICEKEGHHDEGTANGK